MVPKPDRLYQEGRSFFGYLRYLRNNLFFEVMIISILKKIKKTIKMPKSYMWRQKVVQGGFMVKLFMDKYLGQH